MRRTLLPDNPLAGVRAPNRIPTERRVKCTPAAERVIAAANPAWRVIVALARPAGMRRPPEVFSRRWADVNFGTDRMSVTGPKTERIAGKEYRAVPVFAALRPHLEEAFELAEPGTAFVVGGPQADGRRASAAVGWTGTNLRTATRKPIRRAGLTAWPKASHSLRASCETDPTQHHPFHAVTDPSATPSDPKGSGHPDGTRPRGRCPTARSPTPWSRAS